jgi:hypothetical protein
MSNTNLVDNVDQAEIAADNLIDNILELEKQNVLDEQMTDECIYHMRKLAAILGLHIDLDFFNDDYLSERNG